jgi:hypothetical protein
MMAMSSREFHKKKKEQEKRGTKKKKKKKTGIKRWGRGYGEMEESNCR